jgi:sterol desaturase/sphingolipid hydroxylase (fatty acid hydroxylase superfamily)
MPALQDDNERQSQPEPQAPAETGDILQPESHPHTYEVVQELLAQDPYLLYLNETGDLYQVRHSTDLDLLIYKNRALPELFPARRPVLLRKAYRWLWMACLGLLLAGLGAMVFAMLAGAAALGLNFQPITKADRIRSLVVLILSSVLWLGGLLLGAIFLVHLI